MQANICDTSAVYLLKTILCYTREAQPYDMNSHFDLAERHYDEFGLDINFLKRNSKSFFVVRSWVIKSTVLKGQITLLVNFTLFFLSA